MNSSSPNEYAHRPKRLVSLFPWISPLYFITFNTYNRASILARAEVHQAFIEFCRKADDLGVRVGDYVLMLHQNPVRAGLCVNRAEWPQQGQIHDDLGEARQIQRRRHSAVSTRENPASRSIE